MKFKEEEPYKDIYHNLDRNIDERCLDSETSKAIVEHLREEGYPVNDNPI